MDNSSLYLPSYIKKFSCSEIDLTPESVGLYAWYSKLDAGPPDYMLLEEDGKDIGLLRLAKLLIKHTERHSSPKLNLNAVGTFSSKWEGHLEDKTFARLQKALAFSDQIESMDSEYENKRSSSLKDTLREPDQREKLVDLLSTVVPFLTAPIYIGVSKNLKSRLLTHRKILQQATEIVSRDPEAKDRFLNEKKTNFSIRAIGKGFSLDALEVWIFDLENYFGKKCDPDNLRDLRDLAETAEWLLNRWHRPLVGKR